MTKSVPGGIKRFSGAISIIRKRTIGGFAVIFCAALVLLTASPVRALDRLTFAAVNTEEMSLISKQWQEPLNYLGKKLNLKFGFYAATSYAAVVEAMMGGFVDVALLAPEIYIIAHEKAPYLVPINGLARPATKFLPKACACYHSILIVKNGKFNDIAALKGSVLALVEPASTSGAGVPKALFPSKVGAPLEEYFKQTFYAGAQDAAAKAVLAGRADAAFVSDNALSRGIDRGVFSLDTFKVLWTSPEIPTLPIVVNSQKVPKEMVAKLQELLANLKNEDGGAPILKQLNVVDLPTISDKSFDPLRQVLAHEGKNKK
jgi:phosphonate transport system substrate-binding protein